MPRLSDLTVEIRARTAKFVSDMRKAARSVGETDKASKAAATNVKALDAALKGAAVAAIGVTAALVRFAGVEKQLVRVGAVTGATNKEMTQLAATAEKLGATTVFTAKQAAQGMTLLAMAGQDANTVIGAIPAVLDLAQAAAVDLGTSADVVTNIMAGFGKEASELTKTGDTLVATFTGSNTTLTELGEAFKTAGPVAKSLGVGFEDLAAAIGVLGNAGIKGELAGTGLSNVLVNLVNTTPKSAKAMASLGLSADDATGGFDKLVEKLEDARATMSRKEFTGQVFLAFGKRAGKIMAPLVEQGSEAIRKLGARIEESGGIMRKIKDQELATLSGQFDLLKSAVDGVAISFGRELKPAAVAVLGSLRGVSDGVNGLSNPTKNLALSITAVVIAAGPLVKVLSLAKAGTLAAAAAISGPMLLALGGLVAIVGTAVLAYESLNAQIERQKGLVSVATNTKAAAEIEKIKDAIAGVQREIGALDTIKTLGMREVADSEFAALQAMLDKLQQKLKRVTKSMDAIANPGKKARDNARELAELAAETAKQAERQEKAQSRAADARARAKQEAQRTSAARASLGQAAVGASRARQTAESPQIAGVLSTIFALEDSVDGVVKSMLKAGDASETLADTALTDLTAGTMAQVKAQIAALPSTAAQVEAAEFAAAALRRVTGEAVDFADLLPEVSGGLTDFEQGVAGAAAAIQNARAAQTTGRDDSALGALQGGVASLFSNAALIGSTVGAVASMFQQATSAVSGVIANAVTGIFPEDRFGAAATPAIGAAVGVGAAVAAAVAPVVAGLALLGPMLLLVGGAFSIAAGPILFVGGLFVAMAASLATLVGIFAFLGGLVSQTEGFERFMNALGGVMDLLIGRLEPFADGLIALVGLFDIAMSSVGVFADTLGTGDVVMRALFEAVRVGVVAFAILALGAGILQSGILLVVGAFAAIGETFARVGEFIENMFVDIQTFILTGLLGMFAALGLPVGALIKAITDAGARTKQDNAETVASFQILRTNAENAMPDLGLLANNVNRAATTTFEAERASGERFADRAAAEDEATKAVQSFGEQLTNVPAGFKVAAARFEAIIAGQGGGMADLGGATAGGPGGAGPGGVDAAGGGGGNPTVAIDTVIVEARDIQTIVLEVLAAVDRQSFQVAGGTGNSQFNNGAT